MNRMNGLTSNIRAVSTVVGRFMFVKMTDTQCAHVRYLSLFLASFIHSSFFCSGIVRLKRFSLTFVWCWRWNRVSHRSFGGIMKFRVRIRNEREKENVFRFLNWMDSMVIQRHTNCGQLAQHDNIYLIFDRINSLVNDRSSASDCRLKMVSLGI